MGEMKRSWVSMGVGVARSGLSAGAGGRQRPCAAAAALRRGGGGLAELRSFTERLGRYWGTRFGPWVSGRAAPRRAAKGRRPWLTAMAFQWVWVAVAGPRSCGTSRRSSLGVWLGARAVTPQVSVHLNTDYYTSFELKRKMWELIQREGGSNKSRSIQKKLKKKKKE